MEGYGLNVKIVEQLNHIHILKIILRTYSKLIIHFMKNICVLFFLLFSFSFFGQQEEKPNYLVDFITVKDGLSHNYVTSLVSDQLNMKWIGTENGITKYNGYDFDYIKPNEKYQGLLNENIEVLFVDNESNLWIGTKSGGLSYFDIKKNTVSSFNHIIGTENFGDIRITALNQDDEGHIWIGTWRKGVFVLDKNKKKLVRHYNYINKIYSIKKDHLRQMWFSNDRTIYIYNSSKEGLKSLKFDDFVSDILPDENRNTVWVSVSNPKKDVLYAYHQESGDLTQIQTNVFSNFSKKLHLDSQNRIWIGTWGNGVYRSNTNVSEFTKINLINDSSERIEGNYSTILDIHEDKNKVIWLSTASGGVVKLLEGNGFQNLASSITNTSLKERLNCTTIFKNEKFIFIGTLFSGLYMGTNEKDLVQLEAIGNVKIVNMYAFKNQLYIGTAEGFHIFDMDKGKLIFTQKRFKKITAFLIKDDFLYMGTQQNGIAKAKLTQLDKPKTYQFYGEEQFDKSGIKSNRITGIKSDANQNIWVSTYNGLHLYNAAKDAFVHHTQLVDQPISISIINSLELKGSLVWLSTPNGLFKLNYKNKQLQFLEIFGKEEGLNSDFICAATFDDNLNLWISTHTEIVKYNKADQTLTSYGENNGVKTSLFNNNSVHNQNNKTIFFGGIDNITYFNPTAIHDFNTVPEVVFTALRVKNKQIEFGEAQENIDKNLNYAEKINLSYKDDFFTIRFVANDFLEKLNIKYRYILEGYQNQWVELQGLNEINFAGLAPGNYTLKVQASRNNQNWSEAKVLTIDLAGSPWKSTLAIIIYLLIVISIISYFVVQYNYRTRLKNKLEIAKLDKKKKVEIAESKLNFFTNISHEFRTPLTLISSPVKELLEHNNLPSKVYKNLNYIDKNTNRLLNLVNQLLDYRRADYGILKLKVYYGNFVRFSNEVFLYFNESAKAKNIKYTFETTKNDITFPFDRNKMEIVLCNLLSNAIKFTERGGKIEFKINQFEDYCLITIEDNGIGMNIKDINKIFDRFFQIENAKTAKIVGSGIGLSFSKKIVELHHGEINVKSKEKYGTIFTIKLSINPNTYSGEVDESIKKTDDIEAYDTQNLASHTNNGITNERLSILLVDDNEEILEYLSDILREDFKIMTATNGEKGVNKALTNIPDLIVSDVMMPVKDGIALCKELKTNITTSHIPIILLTARTSTVYEIEGLEHGADDYVKKPFNASIIKARINSIIDNRNKIKSHFLNKIRFEPSPSKVDENDDAETKFIKKAIKMVEDNLQNESFDIESLTEELNMSRSSLFRKIKSLTGLSLSAFIRSIRVKKAAQLILTEDLSLKEIAYEVGFNTYKYFKVSFEKQFDCLPSDYKEKHHQNNS